MLANTVAIFVLGLSYRGTLRGANRFIGFISRNTLGIMYIHNLVRISFLTAMGHAPMLLDALHGFLGSVAFALVLLCVSAGIVVALKHIPVLRKMV